MYRHRDNLSGTADGTGNFTISADSTAGTWDASSNIASNVDDRPTISEGAARKIRELEAKARQLERDQDSRLEAVNAQIEALKQEQFQKEQFGLVRQDQGSRTLRFDADLIHGIRSHHIEGLEEEIERRIKEARFRKGDRVTQVGMDYYKGVVKDIQYGGQIYVEWENGYGSGFYTADQLDFRTDVRVNPFRVGDQVEHSNHPDSVGVIKEASPDDMQCSVEWIHRPFDVWIDEYPHADSLRLLPMGAKIQQIEQEKAELEQKLATQSEQITNQADQVEQLRQMLVQAMDQITELRDQGKEEEAAKLEEDVIEISGLPVLAGMGRRQKIKTIAKYAASVGKILGKEVLVRLLRQYDAPGAILRFLGLM